MGILAHHDALPAGIVSAPILSDCTLKNCQSTARFVMFSMSTTSCDDRVTGCSGVVGVVPLVLHAPVPSNTMSPARPSFILPLPNPSRAARLQTYHVGGLRLSVERAVAKL